MMLAMTFAGPLTSSPWMAALVCMPITTMAMQSTRPTMMAIATYRLGVRGGLEGGPLILREDPPAAGGGTLFGGGGNLRTGSSATMTVASTATAGASTVSMSRGSIFLTGGMAGGRPPAVTATRFGSGSCRAGRGGPGGGGRLLHRSDDALIGSGGAGRVLGRSSAGAGGGSTGSRCPPGGLTRLCTMPSPEKRATPSAGVVARRDTPPIPRRVSRWPPKNSAADGLGGVSSRTTASPVGSPLRSNTRLSPRSPGRVASPTRRPPSHSSSGSASPSGGSSFFFSSAMTFPFCEREAIPFWGLA